MIFQKDIITGKVCPYCFERSFLVNSKIIYPEDYGMIFYCKPCDARVGVHKNTGKALGRLAKKELRFLKVKTHLYFDAIWTNDKKQGRTKKQARTAGYNWLSRMLQIPIYNCHIGMFDEESCQKVIDLCLPYYQKLKN